MAQPDSAELKLMRSTKFPPTFTKKVDIRKVNMEVMQKWMAQRITELLGMEDDVTVDFAFELMNDKTGASFNPNIKLLQIKMQGFLGEEASAKFCGELWDLMLSAQDSSLGVPSQLLEAKKAELMQERVRQLLMTLGFITDVLLVGSSRKTSTRRQETKRA